MVVSGDELDVLQGLLISGTGGCGVVGQLFNYSQYHHEDIPLKPGQIVDPLHLVCNIRERHPKDLPESMREQCANMECAC